MLTKKSCSLKDTEKEKLQEHFSTWINLRICKDGILAASYIAYTIPLSDIKSTYV